MSAKGFIFPGGGSVRGDRAREGLEDGRRGEIQFGGGTFEGFADDLRGGGWGAEERLRDGGDLAFLIFGGAFAGHRGRRADADDLVAAKGEAAAADQQSHIRSLPAAVGMEFVEDEKAEPLGGADQRAVLIPGQEQFEHHVVGQQDVGRIVPDGFTRFLFFLSRETGEAYG